ncbi:DUF4097 family beta strand repeat-containing protein [Paenibacillus harenae]|uniref:DUF4097 family beta strand repeat-containing protein n=1 Tax=Paenibacillus harenae TaxID=306543 RepID=UPI000405C23E|nr:DUF4097 family beta strand repeat-containing protein [Paenibacillus harenae]
MKKAIAIALIMLGAGIAGCVLYFDWKDIRSFGTEPVLTEKTIEAESIRNVQIDSNTMNIEVVRGTSENIEVRLDGRASRKYLNNFTLKADAKGDTAYIESTYEDTFSIGFNFMSVDLVVELPDRLWDSVAVKTISGNIDIERMKATKGSFETGSGNLEMELLELKEGVMESRSGNMAMEELTAGEVSIQLKSGDLKMEDYTVDQLTIRNVSGDISLEDGTGRIDGETANGDIQVETEELLHDVSLKSSNGNVRLDTAKEPASAAVHFKTKSGNLNIDWSGIAANIESEEMLSGTIGSGQMKITLESGSGNIRAGIN